ncbi:hypothetical protein BJ878DRAFT_477661 [Calycina marina]|uniref:Uncharacterized protein n=1 Tax=Calycina marina TaxID=1763456 RepID=A0A9P7Z877_9HELO|nr:hypothetical protein BJ878DRAFT_477661 [Calycina marina]
MAEQQLSPRRLEETPAWRMAVACLSVVIFLCLVYLAAHAFLWAVEAHLRFQEWREGARERAENEREEEEMDRLLSNAGAMGTGDGHGPGEGDNSEVVFWGQVDWDAQD